MFDTSSLECWRAQTAETFFPMSITTPRDRPFRARLAAHELGAVAIGRVTAGPNACLRTPRDIATGDPELLRILVLRHGRTHVQQGDRECTITDGDLVVYDSSRPFAVHAQRPFDLVVCGLPIVLLGAHADRMRDLSATRIPHDAPVARMFASFVEGIADELGRDGVAGAELELADTLVAFSRALARREDPRAGGRLRGVQAWLGAHLADPCAHAGPDRRRELHLRPLAAPPVRGRGRHGVGLGARPPAGGLPPRPDRSHPGRRGTVAEIAQRWGWTDAAGFSRRFRAAYGCSPSELRAERQLPRPGAEPELDEHLLDG